MKTLDYSFPFVTQVDLSPLVQYWEELAADPANPWSAYARSVVAEVEGIAEFQGPIADTSALEPYEDEVGRLMSMFLAPAHGGRTAAAMVPWGMRSFFQSEGAAEADLVERTISHVTTRYQQEDVARAMAMKAYGLILEEVYDIRLGFELPFSWISFRDIDSTIPLRCPETHVVRRISVDFDPRFVRVDVVGERPEVTEEQIAPLVNDPHALRRLMELLPPERFLFRGVTMLFGEDVTTEAALTAIRDDLLMKDALTTGDAILHIQEHVRAFTDIADLELGLIGIERGDDVEAVAGGRPVGRSLLLQDGEAPACPHRAHSKYAQAMESIEPLLVGDLEAVSEQTGYELSLLGRGLRSLMILPLLVDGVLIGLLELASPRPGVLGAINLFRIEKVQSIFAQGLKRSLDEQDDRVQAIIKRDYTAIHPVVEWRFQDAARKRLEAELEGRADDAEEIVFGDLTPIYGLSDIRGSSALRNAAIVSDLERQLGLALDVIKAAQSARPQPALGELEFRLRRSLDSLHPEMASDDESSVFEYLQSWVEPLMDELARLDSVVREAVEAYLESLDGDLGIVYQDRREFELSVGMLNDIVSGVLQAEDEYAQSLVPHFFELFKTDGVDYNIYVGSSLDPMGRSRPLDLANLRLWQLMTMCRIEWALTERLDELPVPLRSTHLVLAQSTPLAIRFRRDEKRFDVDGAYNVRYEIVKKRIDKALIRGTSERLTQPGMIAIVYSHDRDEAEYLRYLQYLVSAGFIEEEVESLEIEPLQGVYGLRGLRVRVRPREEREERAAMDSAVEGIRTIGASSG